MHGRFQSCETKQRRLAWHQARTDLHFVGLQWLKGSSQEKWFVSAPLFSHMAAGALVTMSRWRAWLLTWFLILGAHGGSDGMQPGASNSKPWFPGKNFNQGVPMGNGALSMSHGFVDLAKYKFCMWSNGDTYGWYRCDGTIWTGIFEPNTATSLVLRSDGGIDVESKELHLDDSPGWNFETNGISGDGAADPLRRCDRMNHFQYNSGNIYNGAIQTMRTIQSSLEFSLCPCLSIGRAISECDGANLFQDNAGNVNRWDNLQVTISFGNPCNLIQFNSGHIYSNDFFYNNSGNFNFGNFGTKQATLFPQCLQLWTLRRDSLVWAGGRAYALSMEQFAGWYSALTGSGRDATMVHSGGDQFSVLHDSAMEWTNMDIFSNGTLAETCSDGERVAMLGTVVLNQSTSWLQMVGTG